MPYRCVHCSALYADEAQQVLDGCRCGSKFFFYMKEEKVKEILQQMQHEVPLSEAEKVQIEEEVRELTGIEDEETPVFLDFESVRVMKPGKYAIDLPKLFSKAKPKIYQLEDGKYIVDIQIPDA